MRSKATAGGWRAVVLVGVVYVYFLIFAQFGFLARLAECGIAGNALKAILAAMAVGGILLSLLTPRLRIWNSPALRLRIGLVLCALVAACTLLRLNLFSALPIAFLIGAGLGIVTVTVVTHLRLWAGNRSPILMVGLGTGIGYLVCNIPSVFTASPASQALLTAALCVAAMTLPLDGLYVDSDAPPEDRRGQERRTLPFSVALIAFSALVWLDSAAFYIIQHTPQLKAGTWMGHEHLWANGGLHFAAAIIGSLLLDRGRSSAVLACAFGALAFACILLQYAALTSSASLFYPVGVSLYSVALVAYPSFLTPAQSSGERGRQAGWIYAIAGWIGSALGIGMGQNLGRVPIAFVILAGAAVLSPLLVSLLRKRARECALITAGLLVALGLDRSIGRADVRQDSAIERGKQVYISEGCISCHSQFVRPNSSDVLIWGPVRSMNEIHRETPPLIGNRRQGPDLSQVGARRSGLWLKAHTINPREVSYHSVMPSYAFLFNDRRGDDLVAYLESLRGGGQEDHVQQEAAWRLPASAWSDASTQEGADTFDHHCATCHDGNGAALLHWRQNFKKLPPDLSGLRSAAGPRTVDELARIARFGIAATDMPGHEYLTDRQIAALVLWLKHSPAEHPPHS